MNRAERRRAGRLARHAEPSDISCGFETWKPGMVDMSSPDRVTLAGITIEGAGISAATGEVIKRTTLKVLAEHGARAFEAPKTSAAIHEAGHVVLHTLHGDRVEWTGIRRHETGNWLGYTSCSGSAVNGGEWPPETYLKIARNLYAGICAERLFDPECREGSSIDEWVMSQITAAQAALRLD